MQSNKIISFLVLLSVVQTVLILFLVFADTKTETNNDYAASADYEESAVLSKNPEQDKMESGNSFGANNTLSESQLRSIIRQELSALNQSNSIQTQVTQNDSSQYQNSELLIDAVNEQFDIFIASEGVSPNDMEKFYYQVSKLPKEERANAMKRFARSINNGEIRVTQ